jgi:hypothetical protein
LAEDITVAQIGTTLTAGFNGFAIVDTAADITAGLAQIETLALTGKLLSVEPTDANPIFTLSAATISADADALDAQNISPYPIILTDGDPPTITLQSYQLNYNMLNNVLGAIAGPYSLDIVGSVSAQIAAIFVTEVPSVLAYLATPLDVSDDAGGISTDIDELEALAKLSLLQSVYVLDGATTPITFNTLAQESADQDALNLFTGAFSTEITCFLSGTRIATVCGEVAVEHLRIGDCVLTDAGALRPVCWIGTRSLYASRHPQPALVQPVRVRRDAFAAGRPHRDLFLSPDHAVFIDDVLVMIRQLVNGATIAQIPRDKVTYYHVELDSHDVLLAEGLPVESYLDTGNRGLFENGDAPMMLHPDLSGADEQVRREMLSCAPFVTDAARVEPLWRGLASRARQMGHVLPTPATTSDPALCISINGRIHKPFDIIGNRYIFALPQSTSEARLISRSGRTCDTTPWIDDRRRLGVPISRIITSGALGVVDVPVDHPSLADGWWTTEGSGGRLWRCTDGDAELPIPPDVKLLEVHLACKMTYLMDAQADPAVPRFAAA